jgi:hypothetical protein
LVWFQPTELTRHVHLKVSIPLYDACRVETIAVLVQLKEELGTNTG